MNISFVMVKFVINDGIVNTYLKQIQYFFTHTVDLPSELTKHYLAYIQWYQYINLINIRFYFSIDDEERLCNVEL